MHPLEAAQRQAESARMRAVRAWRAYRDGTFAAHVRTEAAEARRRFEELTDGGNKRDEGIAVESAGGDVGEDSPGT